MSMSLSYLASTQTQNATHLRSFNVLEAKVEARMQALAINLADAWVIVAANVSLLFHARPEKDVQMLLRQNNAMQCRA